MYPEVCQEGTGGISKCSVCWDSIGDMENVEGDKCGIVLATLTCRSSPWGKAIPLFPPTRMLSSAAAFAAPACCSHCFSWHCLCHRCPGSAAASSEPGSSRDTNTLQIQRARFSFPYSCASSAHKPGLLGSANLTSVLYCWHSE